MLKARVLDDFIAETTIEEPNTPSRWIVFMEGSSNAKGNVAKFLLESDHGLTVEVTVRFKFTTYSSQIEYKACLDGLHITLEMGAK